MAQFFKQFLKSSLLIYFVSILITGQVYGAGASNSTIASGPLVPSASKWLSTNFCLTYSFNKNQTVRLIYCHSTHLIGDFDHYAKSLDKQVLLVGLPSLQIRGFAARLF